MEFENEEIYGYSSFYFNYFKFFINSGIKFKIICQRDIHKFSVFLRTSTDNMLWTFYLTAMLYYIYLCIKGSVHLNYPNVCYID